MSKDTNLCAAKTRAIHQAGVNQLVENDDVLFAEQCADRANRRGVAGGKTNRSFGAFEGGKELFKLVVWTKGATDQTRSAGAGAIPFGRFDGSSLQGRVVGEAEIVI